MVLTLLLNVMAAISVAMFSIIYTKAFLQTEGKWYSRLWMAMKTSLVVAWGAVVISVTYILDVISVFADQLNAGAGDQIKSAVDPKWTAAVAVAIMLVSVIARLRSLWKSVSS